MFLGDEEKSETLPSEAKEGENKANGRESRAGTNDQMTDSQETHGTSVSMVTRRKFTVVTKAIDVDSMTDRLSHREKSGSGFSRKGMSVLTPFETERLSLCQVVWGQREGQ